MTSVSGDAVCAGESKGAVAPPAKRRWCAFGLPALLCGVGLYASAWFPLTERTVDIRLQPLASSVSLERCREVQKFCRESSTMSLADRWDEAARLGVSLHGSVYQRFKSGWCVMGTDFDFDGELDAFDDEDRKRYAIREDSYNELMARRMRNNGSLEWDVVNQDPSSYVRVPAEQWRRELDSSRKVRLLADEMGKARERWLETLEARFGRD